MNHPEINMIRVHVFILCPDHPWKISLNCFYKKKKVETNVKSHLNQLILTIVTINQFRLLLNINIALYFTCIGAICLFYIWGINIYLIFFFSIANFMKICQICLNWMFISLKKMMELVVSLREAMHFNAACFLLHWVLWWF